MPRYGKRSGKTPKQNRYRTTYASLSQYADRRDTSGTGRGSHDGIRESIGANQTLTVNSSTDKRVPDGVYITVTDGDQHNTQVLNADGTNADVKANRDSVDVPTQPQ